ncbi:hypothetical protein V2A60_002335 [Cordyceps javanica]
MHPFAWRYQNLENTEPALEADLKFSCPQCQWDRRARVDQGKRRITIGQLYPAIICFDEPHPQRSEIEKFIAKDEHEVQMLIIMGTSLAFDGPMVLAQRLATSVRKRKGKIIYANKTRPQNKIVELVDYWVKSECDAWTRNYSGEMTSEIGGSSTDDWLFSGVGHAMPETNGLLRASCPRWK